MVKGRVLTKSVLRQGKRKYDEYLRDGSAFPTMGEEADAFDAPMQESALEPYENRPDIIRTDRLGRAVVPAKKLTPGQRKFVLAKRLVARQQRSKKKEVHAGPFRRRRRSEWVTPELDLNASRRWSYDEYVKRFSPFFNLRNMVRYFHPYHPNAKRFVKDNIKQGLRLVNACDRNRKLLTKKLLLKYGHNPPEFAKHPRPLKALKRNAEFQKLLQLIFRLEEPGETVCDTTMAFVFSHLRNENWGSRLIKRQVKRMRIESTAYQIKKRELKKAEQQALAIEQNKKQKTESIEQKEEPLAIDE